MKTLVLTLGLLLPLFLHADDWSQFLGPDRNGRSAETGLLDRFPATGPAQVWIRAIGTGYSAPSVRGQRLVVHHRPARRPLEGAVEVPPATVPPAILDTLQNLAGVREPTRVLRGHAQGKILFDLTLEKNGRRLEGRFDESGTFVKTGEEEIVECLDVLTGKTLWEYAYPSRFVDPYGYNNGPRCTPLLTTNRCFTFGAEGKLLCLDLEKGIRIWERDTAKDWDVPEAFFGVGSTPVLEDGRLFVMVGGQPNSGMVALDPATGKTLWESVGEKNWQGVPMTGWPGDRTVSWKRHDKQASYATPVLATVHGRRTLFCLMRQGLVALNPTNGEVHASFFFRSRADDSVNAAQPVVVGNDIFISGAYYKVGSVLLRMKENMKGFEELWRDTVLEIHWNTPILHDGYLYAFSGRNEPDARVRCVDFKTGKLMWDRDESWAPHSSPQPLVFGRGSAILAEGKLIILGEGGLLGLFKANPTKLEEISRFQVPALHHPCWAAPVLANKRLYLRSENALVCLDFRKP